MTKAYHFIGIGGIGMSGLAHILLKKEAEVSGSDIAQTMITEGLIKAGAHVYQKHTADHIQQHMTVVYSSDIKPDNPEYLAAIKKQCMLLHRSDLLAHLLSQHRSLAVTGTHGKTTTSALLSTVLVEAGLDPSFAVGGMLAEFHANSRFGEGPWFAFEADESDRSFLKYHPDGAIITNIDRDHLNSYSNSESELIASFKQFISQVTSPDYLLWCGDDLHLKQCRPPGQSYGFSLECDWRALRFRQEGFKIFFDIEGKGKRYQEVEVSLTGEHNALNALAVFALTLALGIEETVIRRALKNFKGVMRRCEKKGESHGVLFLDDYAHHPTEIAATLKAMREAIQERRFIAVFQPHRYSRTQDCLGTYGSIFERADEVIITDIYGAGEEPIPGLSSQQMIEEVKKESTVSVRYVPRSQLSSWLASFVHPLDVVATLGAGDVTKLGPEVMNQLQASPPRRLKLGLIFGGSATEHEVSIRSAQHFKDSFRSHSYDVTEFGITPHGQWITGSTVKQQLESKSYVIEETKSLLGADIMEPLLACDVLVPVLHGPLGEDGTIQGFFEILKKAYVGCDHRAAAISMDKVICKKLALQEGIRTSPFIDFSLHDWQVNHQRIQEHMIETLSFPVFVKPTHLGSTVGIKKVTHPDQLAEAIQYAFYHDTHVLVENGISGREIEFAVLGNDHVYAFPPGEILTDGAVYDYQAKYSKNGAKTTPRADLSPKVIEEGRELARQIYRLMGCSGMARIDFFLESNEIYWFNEVNPIPGFTVNSLYPQMCASNGLDGSSLMDKLIGLALHRRRRQDRIEKRAKVSS